MVHHRSKCLALGGGLRSIINNKLPTRTLFRYSLSLVPTKQRPSGPSRIHSASPTVLYRHLSLFELQSSSKLLQHGQPARWTERSRPP